MRILVGTVGQSVLATDDGETWSRVGPVHGFHSDAIDGIRRSVDGGDTWTRVNGPITNPDGHAASVTPGPPKAVFVTVNNEIHFSHDDGATWQSVGVKQQFPYTHIRDVVFDAVDPSTAWAAIGDSTPGTTGVLMRTRDGARSWERIDMPVEPNSAMWVVQTQPDTPELMFAASRYGYLYRSDDRGTS